MAKKTMYLGYQGDKIKFYTEQPLDKTLYCLDKVEKTNLEYIVDGDEYVLKTEAVEEKLYKEQRIPEILAELEAIDAKSIRALRAGEESRLAEYEEEAQALRDELHSLQE